MIGLGYHFITYRKPVLSVIMINVQTTSENAEAAFDEFSDATGYDKKQQPIDVSANLQFSDDPNATTDYNDYMVLSTMIGAGGEDLFFRYRKCLHRLCRRRCADGSAHLCFG